MSLITVAIVVLGVANNALFAQAPHITETISDSLLSTTQKVETFAYNFSTRTTAAVADATQNIKLIFERTEQQEIVIGFEDDSHEEIYSPQIARAEPVGVEVFEQNSFPPQTQPLYGAQIYTPENTYTTINSKDIEQKLLIQKNYFSKQIDRIYDRVKNNTQDVNERIDSVTASGMSFATIALGGTGISTVPSYGQLLIGDGSGGYTLIATSSLGISSGVSSQWTTNGSDIYYTTGNVGIGTTTPQYGLHIFKSVGSASQNIQTVDAAGEAAINLENTVRRWKIKATTASGDAFVIRDQTAAQDRFIINGAGNIGISSTSPTSKLSVVGNSYFGGNVTIGATASGPQLTVNAVGNGNDTELVLGDGLGQYWGITRENSVGNAARGDLSFYSTDARAGELLTLGARGLVGIGTTSPYAKLSVSGSSIASTTFALRPMSGQTANILDVYNTSGVLNTVITAAGNLGVGIANPTEVLHVVGNIFSTTGKFMGAQSDYIDIGVTDNTTRFYTSNTGTFTSQIGPTTYFNAGNVGIGSTSPTSKLSVVGNSYFGGNVTIGATASGPQLTVNAAGNGNDTELILGDGLGQYWGITRENSVGNAARGDLSFYSTDARAGDLLTLGARGLVGIGTSSPYAKLSVAGTSIASTTLALTPIVSQTANVLDVYSASGVLSTVITAGGNVGIGTSGPGAKLHVNGGDIWTIGTNPSLLLGDSAVSGNYGYIQWNSTNDRLDIFSTAGATPQLSILESGSIGIGTTTPSSALSVVSPGLSVFDIVSVTGALRNEGGAGLRIAPTIQAVTSVKNSMSALNVSPVFMDNLSGTDVVDFASIRSTAMTGGIAGAMTNTYGLYVEPNTQGTNNYGAYIGGSVGIGTTTPVSTLDVNGTTRLGGPNAGVYPALVLNNKSADASGVGVGLQFKNRNDASNHMGSIQTIYRGGITSALTMMDFLVADAITPKMTLSGSGNLGIGTTSPFTTLSVVGDGWFENGSTKITVKNSANSVKTEYASNSIQSYNSNLFINAAGNNVIFSATSNVGIGTTTPASILHLDSGTASLPSISLSASGGSLQTIGRASASFTGAGTTDFGIRFSNKLWLGNTGTASAVLDSSGNFGIGTTTPASRLHLTTADNDGIIIDTLNQTTRSHIFFREGGLSSYGGYLGYESENGQEGLFINTLENSTENRGLFIKRTNGYVGVGTSSPLAKLDIYDASASSAIVLSSGYNTGADSNKNWGLFQSGFNYGDFAIKESNTVGGNPISAGTTRLLIQKVTGNVGIGTTTPASLLHLSGNGAVPQLIISGTAAGQNMKDWRFVADSTSLFLGTLNESTTATGDYAIRLGRETNSNDVDYIEFATNNEANKMRYTNAGNLGIGTTSPTSKLGFGNGLGDKIALWEDGSIKYGFGIQASLMQIYTNSSSADISFGYGDSSNFTRNVTFKGSGNVGIGTSTPQRALSIYKPSTPTLQLTDFTAGESVNDGFLLTQTGLSTYLENAEAGPMYFRTSATNRMVIDATGNVGIGTTTPQTQLEVAGTVSGQPGIIRISKTGPSSVGDIFGSFQVKEDRYFGDVLTSINTITSVNQRRGVLTFSTDHEGTLGEKMRIDNFGNVGIGTTSPNQKLNVIGSVEIGQHNLGTVAPSQLIFGEYQSSGATRPAFVFNGPSAWMGMGQADLTTNTLRIGSAPSAGQAFNSFGSVPVNMIIDGNVGIGTTSPLSKLHIAGNSTPQFRVDGYGTDVNAEQRFMLDGSTVVSMGVDDADSDKFKILYNTSLTGSSGIIITSNGNVGIGTTSPTYKLEVAGDVGATSFINMSSRSVKKDISYVPFEQTQQTLDKIKALKFATYRYVTENDSEPLHLGLIAEESPEDILAPGGRGIDVYKLATFALQGIQSLIARIEKLEAALANVSTGFTDIFKAKTVEVEQGITIKDSKTGEYYCIVVENGSMKNIPGKCGSTPAPEANDSDNETDDSSDNSEDSSNSTDSSDSSSSSGNQDSQNDETNEEQEVIEDSSEDSDTGSNDATTTNVDNTGDTSEEESTDSSTDSGSEAVSDSNDSESTTSETSDSASSESADSSSSSESSSSESSDSSVSTESSSSSESSSSTDGGSSDTQ